MAVSLRRNSKGFTLVELLIVVAIIGVLSTIGVPTFRKMVTKAKKSEAKVSLGGLFTVESAFFTEYSVYGNNLDKVGFEIEGRQKLYSTGFPTASCDNDSIAPLQSTAQGTALIGLITDYYSGTPVTVRQRGAATASGTVGGTTVSTCFANGSTPSLATSGVNAVTRSGVGVETTGATFVASATGNIAPGVQSNAGFAAGAPIQDVWVIDNARTLVNWVDGTN